MAVALLLRRSKETTAFGLAAGLTAPRIAVRLQSGIESAITEARVISRATGINSLVQEVATIGGRFESVLSAPSAGIPRDIRRARVFSANFAKGWLKKAEGDTVAKAVRAANAGAASNLKRLAVTESSEAFNRGRSDAALELKEGGPSRALGGGDSSLLKIWDSQLDKLTCPVCFIADGTIVGIKENFPLGEPGAVHPWCRCTWRVLTFQERGGAWLIETKPLAKVISFPSKHQ